MLVVVLVVLVLVVLVLLVLLVAASARPAFEAGESRGGEERRPLTGYFYFSARLTHTDNCQYHSLLQIYQHLAKKTLK